MCQPFCAVKNQSIRFALVSALTMSGIRMSWARMPGTAVRSAPDRNAENGKLEPVSPARMNRTAPQTRRPATMAERRVANIIGSLLNMKVAPGNSSIFVGNKEFEIMKKPGRGTNGHIAIGCNNVDRAIYHLSQRGVKFDLDSKNVKNGKTIACYFADEIGGFAFHLVQA